MDNYDQIPTDDEIDDTIWQEIRKRVPIWVIVLAGIGLLVWFVFILIGWIYYGKISAVDQYSNASKIKSGLLAGFGIFLFPLELGPPIIYVTERMRK